MLWWFSDPIPKPRARTGAAFSGPRPDSKPRMVLVRGEAPRGRQAGKVGGGAGQDGFFTERGSLGVTDVSLGRSYSESIIPD